MREIEYNLQRMDGYPILFFAIEKAIPDNATINKIELRVIAIIPENQILSVK